MDDLKDTFANPPAAYRGKPFWAWNGKLEAAELRRQIRVMKRMGLGGFFMHSRVGLATAYLSEEWFEMVRACVDEARKQDMEAWLYDEDRWPSGAAGGLVTKDKRYRQKRLVMVICEPGEAKVGDQQPLAVFSARIDGMLAREVERLSDTAPWDTAAEGKNVLAFFVRTARTSPWYNDATYLDTMSLEAVDRFIELTHEGYRTHVGDAFGSVIPGIFTDEPNHGGTFARTDFAGLEAYEVPWTPRLPELYEQRYSEDLLDHLPEIFFLVDEEPLSAARHRYHDCKTHAFVDAFARRIGEWCDEQQIEHTGHVLSEPTLRSQSDVVGSAMRFYEYMQAPGIDVLTEELYEYSTAKQCSSVAHQMGRRWMLSELYGCTGWDFGFEGHKAIGDWQAALGVNLRCQHLSWYTMAGQAKRDYPASIHFHSPWWQHYGKVEDYFARVGVLLSRGEPVRKLLVIHPVESLWARATLGWAEDRAIERLERQFSELLEGLLEEHLDFDYGDEEMISRLAQVEPGSSVSRRLVKDDLLYECVPSGAHRPPLFRLGHAAYEAVLVPPLLTCRSSTLRLLRQFAGAGGRVVVCGEPPGYVDCRAPEPHERDAFELFHQIAYDKAAIAEALDDARTISIRDADGREKRPVLYQMRRHGNDLYLFMCNTDRDNGTGPLTVSVQADGQLQLWDAETGRRFSHPAETRDGKVAFETEMPPSGSRLFVVSPGSEDLPLAPVVTEVRSVELSEGWQGQRDEQNVLVLDFARYRTEGGAWQGPQDVLRIDQELRAAIGLRERGSGMVQPWARPKEEDGPHCQIELLYEIKVDQPPEGPPYLAIEDPARFDVRLNGHAIPTDAECRWWVDPSIRMLPLDVAWLRSGTNELTMRGRFDRDANLEVMFILGDFSVEVSGADCRITGKPPEVGLRSWTEQGLPFYGGSVTFRKRMQVDPREGERVFVEVPHFGGACVRVLVDGQEAGIIGWQPHEMDVTPLCEGKGEIELGVEVVAHRRNTFGPLHLKDPKPRFVGPDQFISTGDEWQDAYHLVPCGLLSAPRLSYRTEA